jgi:hypothetical protein
LTVDEPVVAPALGRGRSRTTQQADDPRERRIELLIRRLPRWLQTAIRWLRQPSARWVRIPAALVLMVGGCLAILPVFGLWMLPLGLVLLAEDIAPLRRLTDRGLAWIERRRPHWMGLPRTSTSNVYQSSGENQ